MRVCFPQHSPDSPRASGYTQVHRAPTPGACEADPDAYDLGTLHEAFDVLHPGKAPPDLSLTHHPDEDNEDASDWRGSSAHLALLLCSALEPSFTFQDTQHLWATGALDTRADLQRVEHVPEKLALFAKHTHGERALFLAPAANKTKLPSNLQAVHFSDSTRPDDLYPLTVLWVPSRQVAALLRFLQGAPAPQAQDGSAHVNINLNVQGDASNLIVAGRDIHHLAAAPQAPEPAPPVFPARKHVFAGRTQEMDELERHFAPQPNEAQGVVVAICALKGMPGVGKSYLAEHFIASHPERWPGGVLRLALDEKQTRDDLLAELAALLHVQAPPAHLVPALRAALTKRRAILLIENADAPPTAALAAQLCDDLPSAPVLLTGRLDNLGAARPQWRRLKLQAFQDEADALDQLRQELADAPHHLPSEDQQRTLVQALGHLPLAIHLAAGYLRAGLTAQQFLQELSDKHLAVNTYDPTDPQRPRQVLHAAFASLLALFRDHAGKHADAWTQALRALSLASAAGFSESLAHALSGLEDPDAFARMSLRARECSLLDAHPATDHTPARLHLHPLLAQWLRQDLTPDQTLAAQQRLAAFFAALTAAAPTPHTPDLIQDQNRRWTAAKQDLPTLLHALATLPHAPLYALLLPSLDYAQAHGPYTSWIAAAQRLLASPHTDDEQRSNALWRLAVLAQRAGDLDLALTTANAKLDLERARDNKREAALAAGKIADILQDRGKLDEALRILQDELLPAFDSLGDVHSRATTMGRIADILQIRGKLDEALHIRQQEQLLVYKSLGDVRSQAVTMGKIADILQTRGKLDEALRILQDELLPVFTSLGDVRSRTIAMGQIADILQTRGNLDEALYIRQQEQLPVYESLGDVRERAVTIGKIADILYERGDFNKSLSILRDELLPAFDSLDDVRSRAITMGKIADILYESGDFNKALSILRDELLPAFDSLGDVRSRAVTMGRIADILEDLGNLNEALHIRRQEELRVYKSLGDIRSQALTMGKIADILEALVNIDQAIKTRRKEHIMYDQIGDVHNLLMAKAELALTLYKRGRREDRPEILMLLVSAHQKAVEMEIPEAAQIEGVMQQIFGFGPGPATP